MTKGASAVSAIDSAITNVNTQRATFGAAINQLTYAVDNLSNVKVEAHSKEPSPRYGLRRRDFELARTQIIQQAGTAILAQANQLPQTVLALLR